MFDYPDYRSHPIVFNCIHCNSEAKLRGGFAEDETKRFEALRCSTVMPDFFVVPCPNCLGSGKGEKLVKLTISSGHWKRQLMAVHQDKKDDVLVDQPMMYFIPTASAV